jgi:hypothetical protein
LRPRWTSLSAAWCIAIHSLRPGLELPPPELPPELPSPPLESSRESLCPWSSRGLLSLVVFAGVAGLLLCRRRLQGGVACAPELEEADAVACAAVVLR